MNNAERQKILDKGKWLASEEAGKDMSGKMPYCEYCEFNQNGSCAIPSSREKDCDCATAYNRQYRRYRK